MKYTLRYLPRILSSKDTKKQITLLDKSKRLYKRGQYFNRTQKYLSSYPHHASKHITHARKLFGVDKIAPTPEYAKATGCSVSALRQIVKKGEGAYYSSGSRPNQTAQSWGYARLASSTTGGKAAAVDYAILERGCVSRSRALKMARTARAKYGHGTSKTKKRVVL